MDTFIQLLDGLSFIILAFAVIMLAVRVSKLENRE